MPKPFISWTFNHEKEMLWLERMLESLGFEKPIVLGRGGSPRPPMSEIAHQMREADCLFALIAAGANASMPNLMSDWIQTELGAAIGLGLPIGALIDKSITLSPAMQQAFTAFPVDLNDPHSILHAAPAFVELALKIERIVKGGVDGTVFPSVLEEVYLTNRISKENWQQTRTLTLTAGPGFNSECQHSVDLGMDHTPGLSVKLANPATDLRVTSKERPNLKLKLLRNDDTEVGYSVTFVPRLKPTETIKYKHFSVHPNIFPLTADEVRQRAAGDASPPFMRDGLVGDHWDVRRKIGKLVLEARVPTDLGFTDPQVRVYEVDSRNEYEDERRRIGSPKVAPKLWEVREDHLTDENVFRVTIFEPVIGRTYALLVRPPD